MDNKLKSGKVKELAQVYTTRKEQITVFFSTYSRMKTFPSPSYHLGPDLHVSRHRNMSMIFSICRILNYLELESFWRIKSNILNHFKSTYFKQRKLSLSMANNCQTRKVNSVSKYFLYYRQYLCELLTASSQRLTKMNCKDLKEGL